MADSRVIEELLHQLHNPDVVGLCDKGRMRVFANAEKLLLEYESSSSENKESLLIELVGKLYD